MPEGDVTLTIRSGPDGSTTHQVRPARWHRPTLLQTWSACAQGRGRLMVVFADVNAVTAPQVHRAWSRRPPDAVQIAGRCWDSSVRLDALALQMLHLHLTVPVRTPAPRALRVPAVQQRSEPPGSTRAPARTTVADATGPTGDDH